MGVARTVDVTTSWIASILRLGLGLGARHAVKAQPEQRLVLYEFEGCPFCRKVREALTFLDLDAEIRPCPKDGPQYRPFVIEHGGQRMFPYLHDPNTDTWMYESGDIIRYLYATYGDRPAPWWLAGDVSVLLGSLASAVRGGRGSHYRPARTPEQPLDLWSAEASPYCRIAREALCELELPYVVHNIGSGSPRREAHRARVGRATVPYLEDPNTGAAMWESADIKAYLRATYGAAVLLLALVLTLGAPSTALASCPAAVPILNTLTCNSEINSQVVHTATSQLGGTCANNACYSCGAPFADEPQLGPEGVYEFTCQVSGSVTLLVTNLPCDVDLYVLAHGCDPFNDCLFGATNSFASDDSVTFTCAANTTYYIVVEAYGVGHASQASGPCEDANGALYTPTYTLSFDVSAGTGCPEDCDDGLDNDFNGLDDCDDPACGQEPLCCDLDADGYFGVQCAGPDCDDGDAAINPGATDLFDNGIDEDCDGVDATAPGDDDDSTGDDDDSTGDDDDSTGDDDDSTGDDDDDSTGDDDDDLTPPAVDDDDAVAPGDTAEFGCGCSNDVAGAGARPGWLAGLLISGAALLRRRRS